MGIVNAVFKDAIRTTDCETCEAEAGDLCVDRRGDPLGSLHAARLNEYIDRLGNRFAQRVAATGPRRTK